VNFRHSSGEPVQLAFDPEFDPMIERAENIDLAGTNISVVRKEDLIAKKQRAAGDPARRKSKRLRDQADIALLLGDVPNPDEGW
jgi:predicted nucleotidyltransferase